MWAHRAKTRGAVTVSRRFLEYLSIICGERNFKSCALFRTTQLHYVSAKVESWVDMGLEKGEGEERMI